VQGDGEIGRGEMEGRGGCHSIPGNTGYSASLFIFVYMSSKNTNSEEDDKDCVTVTAFSSTD
jgi:hypothetical protein